MVYITLMSKVNRILLPAVLCSLMSLLAAGQIPAPAPLNYTNIDLAGQQQTIVGGINDAGIMVGAFRDATGVQHAYITNKDGSFATVDFPGATATLGEGINNRGDIVGSYADAQNVRHGFLFSNGIFTTVDFPAPNAVLNFAADINDRGDIAGIYNTSDSGIHGYIFTRDGFTSIDLSQAPAPFPPTTQAFGIDNRDQVTGDTDDADFNLHGFIFHAGSAQLVDAPGEQQIGVNGISESGELVGSGLDDNFVQHGFLFSKGTFLTVDFPGADGTAPSKVNEKGTIVGRYFEFTPALQVHSFIAVPGAGNGNVSAAQNQAVPRPRPTRICGSQEWRDHPEDIKDPGSCVVQH